MPVALLLDIADGKVARRHDEHSPFGQELDSLADIVSFGVAPAALGYGLGLRGGLDIIILIFSLPAASADWRATTSPRVN